MPDITFAEIESATKTFAADRERLCDAVGTLTRLIEELKRQALPAIKRAVAKTAESHSALSAMIDAARPLFIRPRTVVMHGIKLGLRKGPGGIDWDDDAAVVARIEKLFGPAKASLLIRTVKRPISAAIEDLDIAELKAIGCRVADTGDEIVIKPADSEVDKIVTALLAGAIEEEEAR